MKTTLTVLFTSLLTFASMAHGQTYRTLNGYLDTIQIPAGQTAFVVSASSDVVLEVKSPSSQNGQQFRFRQEKNQFFSYSTNGRNRRNVLPTPSTQSPVPIAGPVKLTLRTSGVLTISLPEVRRTNYGSTSSQRTARRFASN